MPAQATHFIVRPGYSRTLQNGMILQEPGRFVPLIAVDQLPDWIEIVGVPRYMTIQQAVGMIAIGGFQPLSPEDDGTQELFEVRLQHYEMPDSVVDEWPVSMIPSGKVMSPEETEANKNTTNAPATSSAAGKEVASITPASASTPKFLGGMPLRQPCLDWCKTGKCSSGEKCSSLHVMPTTTKGLQEIGLSEPPAWWRQQQKEEQEQLNKQNELKEQARQQARQQQMLREQEKLKEQEEAKQEQNQPKPKQKSKNKKKQELKKELEDLELEKREHAKKESEKRKASAGNAQKKGGAADKNTQKGNDVNANIKTTATGVPQKQSVPAKKSTTPVPTKAAASKTQPKKVQQQEPTRTAAAQDNKGKTTEPVKEEIKSMEKTEPKVASAALDEEDLILFD